MPKGAKDGKRPADVIGNAAITSKTIWSMEDIVAPFGRRAPQSRDGPWSIKNATKKFQTETRPGNGLD